MVDGRAPSTELEASFRRLRQTGDYGEALRPLLAARLVAAGTVIPLYDRPVFYARRSDVTGAPCITASEHRRRIENEPGVTAIELSGIELLFAMDANHDLVILWAEGTEYLEAKQVEWFRETVRRNPFLRQEVAS